MDLKSVSPARHGEARQEPEKRSANTPTAANAQDVIADDAGVDTKCHDGGTFGNDGNGGVGVDTKGEQVAAFGNDVIGFIRVRKRKLKGGHPSVRTFPSFYGQRATSSTSFDLVRAVRVGGKPRHEFLLGLGSQKNIDRHGRHDLCWFWSSAVRWMVKHGLAEDQCRRLIAEMVRKGARLPTIAQCEEHARIWPAWGDSAINEFMRLRPADAEVAS